jgi:hypothetical protein
MAKAKSKGKFMVADGAGGLTQVADRRFEVGDWPIQFEVPKDQADVWFRYINAECGRRGWSSSQIAQLEARENSGSMTINSGGPGNPQLAVVWERRRGGLIKVRARPAGTPEFAVAEAEELFRQANERCRSGAKERLYQRGQLHYEGLAWRGELWLDDAHRLGPPSQQYERALHGPRVILVDALVDCVSQSDARTVFDRILREISVFLTVAMGIPVQLPAQGKGWTWTEGAADCAVRQFGYWEVDNPQQMPARGICHTVPLKQVTRPDFSRRGIDGTMNEQRVPDDVIDLWAKYRGLPPERQRQFLQAAAKWQESLLHWRRDRTTLSVALMVVACEALKPSGAQFKNHNIYHVIEGLLGASHAERLQRLAMRPQDVRSAHLHRGEFQASEFLEQAMWSSYYDPTFSQVHEELALITQAAIIEWLSQRGTFVMRAPERKRKLRQWVRKYAFAALPASLAVGVVLGWLLRRFWFG